MLCIFCQHSEDLHGDGAGAGTPVVLDLQLPIEHLGVDRVEHVPRLEARVGLPLLITRAGGTEDAGWRRWHRGSTEVLSDGVRRVGVGGLPRMHLLKQRLWGAHGGWRDWTDWGRLWLRALDGVRP